MLKTVLFQTIQFSISTQFTCQSGATSLGQSRPGSDGSEGLRQIPQTSSITGISQLDFLVSYQDTLPLCREAVSVFYNSSRLCKFAHS